MAPNNQNSPATDSPMTLRALVGDDPTATLEDDDLLDEDPDDFEDDTEEDEEDEEDDAEDVGASLRASADTEADDDGNDDGRENAVDEDELNAEAEDDLDDPSLDPLEAETIRKRLAVAFGPLAEILHAPNAAAI